MTSIENSSKFAYVMMIHDYSQFTTKQRLSHNDWTGYSLSQLWGIFRVDIYMIDMRRHECATRAHLCNCVRWYFTSLFYIIHGQKTWISVRIFFRATSYWPISMRKFANTIATYTHTNTHLHGCQPYNLGIFSFSYLVTKKKKIDWMNAKCIRKLNWLTFASIII